MRRASAGLLLATLALVAVACDETPPPAPEPTTEPTRTTEESAPEPAPEETPARASRDAERACELLPSRTVTTVPDGTVAIATREEMALVVVQPTGDAPFVAVVESGETVRRAEIPRARGEVMLALEPAGDRFVLVGRAPCTRGGEATSCLVARTISTADPITAGAPVDVTLPGAIRTLRITAEGALLYVAHSHAGTPPSLDRFEVGEDGALSTTHHVFGEAVPEEEPVEILGLTAEGGGWAVLYRHGATEDRSSRVVLVTQLDEHEVSALEEALLVESMAWTGSSLSLIVAYEFARPSWVRVGAEGEVVTEPRALPPGDEPPLPFAGRRTARALGTAEARELEIRDALGDRVGDRLGLGPGTADAAPIDEGFVVAIVRPGGDLVMRDVRCP